MPTESQFQIQVVKWLRSQGYRFYSVPNGGKRGPIAAKQLQNQGLSPGVPDLCICEKWIEHTTGAGGQFFAGVGVYIELKVPGGKLSNEQIEWLDHLERVGYLTAVCYSLDEVKQVCRHIRK